MNIKHRLAKFEKKRVLLLGFFLWADCLTASLIMHVPIFGLHAQWYALMFTLQHEFELSTLPSVPFNGHVGVLC